MGEQHRDTPGAVGLPEAQPHVATGDQTARLRHVAREIRKLATDPTAPRELAWAALELTRAIDELEIARRSSLRAANVARLHSRIILERARSRAAAIVADAELRAARAFLARDRAAGRPWGADRLLTEDLGTETLASGAGVALRPTAESPSG